MSLPSKPHSATRTPKNATVSSRKVTGYTNGTTNTIKGQLTEQRPGQVFERWGRESENPALWLCDLAETLAIGDRLTVNGRNYRVIAGPQLNDAVPAISYAAYLLERE